MRASVAANLLYFPATRLAGERVRHHLEVYRAHDGLSAAELREKQEASLELIVGHARESVPHYSELVTPGSPRWSSAWEALDGLAPLEKALLREQPESFVSNRRHGGLQQKTTSGSTGHPLTVLKNRDALARERAATWRAYGWAGIPVAAPQALLWGMPHSSRGRLRARVLDVIANRKRLSMFGASEGDFAAFHRELRRFRPHYLYGYVSAISEFVRFLSDTRRALPSSVHCIVTTSELLDPATRRFLEDRTGLQVFNEYGCGEVGSIAHECEHGSLHIMSDNVVLECFPAEDLPVGLGELVVTDLHNTAMPLLRYKVGDLGRISDEPCACGRPYPVLERIVGRAYDTIIGWSGRRYHPEAILYIFEDLRKDGLQFPPFQAVQYTDGHVDVNFETDGRMSDQLEKALQRGFLKSFDGDLTLRVGSVDKLKREASGKLRVVRRAAGRHLSGEGGDAPSHHGP
jgi:phenylacetate-CoA ligase